MENDLFKDWEEAIKDMQKEIKDYKEDLALRTRVMTECTKGYKKSNEKSIISDIQKSLDKGLLDEEEKKQCLDDFFVKMYESRCKGIQKIKPSAFRDAYEKEELNGTNLKDGERVDKLLNLKLGPKSMWKKDTAEGVKSKYKTKEILAVAISKDLDGLLDGVVKKDVKKVENFITTLDGSYGVKLINKVDTAMNDPDVSHTTDQLERWNRDKDLLGSAIEDFKKAKGSGSWDPDVPEWYVYAARLISVIAGLLGSEDVKINLSAKGMEKLQAKVEKLKPKEWNEEQKKMVQSNPKIAGALFSNYTGMLKMLQTLKNGKDVSEYSKKIEKIIKEKEKAEQKLYNPMLEALEYIGNFIGTDASERDLIYAGALFAVRMAEIFQEHASVLKSSKHQLVKGSGQLLEDKLKEITNELNQKINEMIKEKSKS